MKLPRRERMRVVRFSGSALSAFEVEESAAGVLRSVTAPHYEFSADACQLVAPNLYAIAVDEVTMRSEGDFHRSRRRIATSALFENNSDLFDLGRNIAIGVVFVISVVLLFQVGHMAGLVDVISSHIK